MDEQFKNEPLCQVPSIDVPYNYNNIAKSTGFSHLMKLVLCFDNLNNDNINNQNILDMINNILDTTPEAANECNTRTWTPFMLACRHSNTYSNIEIVKLLLKCPNININSCNKKGYTSLLLATIYNNLDVIELLLQHPNININSYNHKGNTSLIFACKHNNIQAIKLLLQHPNININRKSTTTNNTCLMTMCSKNKLLENDIKIIKLLLNNSNININEVNKVGQTALMKLCSKQITEESFEIIKLLLNNQTIDINIKTKIKEKTILIYMCMKEETNKNDIEIIKLLLRNPNINVNLKSSDNLTALIILCNNYFKFKQNITTIKLLLNHPNIDAESALYYIYQKRNIELFDLFIKEANICEIKISNYIDSSSFLTKLIIRNLDYKYFKNIYNYVSYINKIKDTYPFEKYSRINLVKSTKNILCDKMNEILYHPDSYKMQELNLKFDAKCNKFDIKNYSKLINIYDLNTGDKLTNFIKKIELYND